jgi:hypothetical protein
VNKKIFIEGENKMDNVDEMISQAVKVLVDNGINIDYKDVPVSSREDITAKNIELLEFLLLNCPETIKILNKECKKLRLIYRGHHAFEWEVMLQTSYVIRQTKVELDKEYHFGFMKKSPVEILDTISDISQIPMKDRHIVYLNKLKEITPNIDIDAMFIEFYNQTQKELNPYRVEECLYCIRHELYYKGIEVYRADYSEDYYAACNGYEVSPYFYKNNWWYYIKDSFGRYNPSLKLVPKNEDKSETEWLYRSSRWIKAGGGKGYNSKATARRRIKQFRERNAVAGFEGLDWEIVYLNSYDDIFNLMDKEKGSTEDDFIYIKQDISGKSDSM